jgi:hypothetical protein
MPSQGHHIITFLICPTCYPTFRHDFSFAEYEIEMRNMYTPRVRTHLVHMSSEHTSTRRILWLLRAVIVHNILQVCITLLYLEGTAGDAKDNSTRHISAIKPLPQAFDIHDVCKPSRATDKAQLQRVTVSHAQWLIDSHWQHEHPASLPHRPQKRLHLDFRSQEPTRPTSPPPSIPVMSNKASTVGDDSAMWQRSPDSRTSLSSLRTLRPCLSSTPRATSYTEGSAFLAAILSDLTAEDLRLHHQRAAVEQTRNTTASALSLSDLKTLPCPAQEQWHSPSPLQSPSPCSYHW